MLSGPTDMARGPDVKSRSEPARSMRLSAPWQYVRYDAHLGTSKSRGAAECHRCVRRFQPSLSCLARNDLQFAHAKHSVAKAMLNLDALISGGVCALHVHGKDRVGSGAALIVVGRGRRARRLRLQQQRLPHMHTLQTLHTLPSCPPEITH